MKKWKAGLIVMIMICLIPLMSALAWTGTVTADYLNMRKSNSADSKVVKALKYGTKVEVTGTKGSWYKVTVNGKTGYVAKKYIKKGSSSGSSSSSNSSSSSSSSSSSMGTCKSGDKGGKVKAVQERLKDLGYLSGSPDGDYGNGTKKAVIAFQKRNGLKQTGSVNSATLKKLKSSYAKSASGGSGGSDSSGGGGSSGTTTEILNWFKHPDRIPHHATFKVKDCKTGKVFTVKRWTGANHADCEPATASDTKIMKSIFGHWSWKRRPILVKYNGHVYAASMNGMPHGTQTIKNNNFDGHFCIHFTGSKTHGTKKVDSAHQSCVKTARKYTW